MVLLDDKDASLFVNTSRNVTGIYQSTHELLWQTLLDDKVAPLFINTGRLLGTGIYQSTHELLLRNNEKGRNFIVEQCWPLRNRYS